jgi:hypothetical protein
MPTDYIAFAADQQVARGSLSAVAEACKIAFDAGAPRALQVFDAATSEPVDLDLSGTMGTVLARYRERPEREFVGRAGPGRPKLGVVAREVTLLPRHWDWLATQPGGASAALRRLVDAARASHAPRDAVRQAQERTYRFVVATLGDAPGFEEAMRALWAANEALFLEQSASWPVDLRQHALALAKDVFATPESN